MPIQRITPKTPVITLELDGPDGNVFFVIAMVRKILSTMGRTKEAIEEVTDKLRNGKDYPTILAMADSYCKGLLVLETKDECLIQNVNRASESLKAA